MKDLLKDEASRAIPKMLENYACWVHSDQKHVIFEKDGIAEYAGVFSAKVRYQWKSPAEKMKATFSKLLRLEKLHEGLPVLNPWTHPQTEMFRELDRQENIVSMGSDNKITHIRYDRLNLEYKWDKRSNKWECCNYPDEKYVLSTKPINQIMYPTAGEE